MKPTNISYTTARLWLRSLLLLLMIAAGWSRLWAWDTYLTIVDSEGYVAVNDFSIGNNATWQTIINNRMISPMADIHADFVTYNRNDVTIDEAGKCAVNGGATPIEIPENLDQRIPTGSSILHLVLFCKSRSDYKTTRLALNSTDGAYVKLGYDSRTWRYLVYDSSSNSPKTTALGVEVDSNMDGVEWLFEGNDPYRVAIKNTLSGTYLNYSYSTGKFSMSTTPSYYMVWGNNESINGRTISLTFIIRQEGLSSSNSFLAVGAGWDGNTEVNASSDWLTRLVSGYKRNANALVSQGSKVTYHLKTHVDGRSIDVKNVVVENRLEVPDAMLRKYCSYKFYSDATLATEIDAYTTGMTDVWVGYTVNEYTESEYCPASWSTLAVPYFSTDYDHARWYRMVTDGGWGWRNHIRVTENKDLGVDDLLNSMSSSEPRYLWAYIGDPYYFKIVNNMKGDGTYLGAVPKDDIYEEYAKMVTDETNAAWEVRNHYTEETSNTAFDIRLVSNKDWFLYQNRSTRPARLRKSAAKWWLEYVGVPLTYTFHLDTHIRGRQLTASHQFIVGDDVELPDELLRKFCDYEFWEDDEHTIPSTVFKASVRDIYVTYKVHEYSETDYNGQYIHFSEDYNHAYWYSSMQAPHHVDYARYIPSEGYVQSDERDDSDLGKDKDGNKVSIDHWPGFYGTDYKYQWAYFGTASTDRNPYRYNYYYVKDADGNYVVDADGNRKVMSNSLLNYTNLAWAYIGDPYDLKVFCRGIDTEIKYMGVKEVGAGKTVYMLADGADNCEWELVVTSSSVERTQYAYGNHLTNATYTLKLVSSGNYYLQIQRNHICSLGTDRPGTSPRRILDRGNVLVHVYDAVKKTLVKEYDYTGVRQSFLADRRIEAVPDSIVLSHLSYTYYPTLEALQSGAGGVSTVGELNITPTVTHVVGETSPTYHIYMAYTIDDDYPFEFSDEDATVWYFIGYNESRTDGFTDEDGDRDNLNYMLRLTDAATPVPMWTSDQRVDHTTIPEKYNGDYCSWLSDRVDATKTSKRWLWKFEGTPYGFKIVNKNGQHLSASNYLKADQNNYITLGNSTERCEWLAEDTPYTLDGKRVASHGDETAPHFTFRLAVNRDMAWSGYGSRLCTKNIASVISGTSHAYCTRVYKYLHKTYFNAWVHLKNEETDARRDFEVSKDDFDFFLEQPVTAENLSSLVKRIGCLYTLYTDGTFTETVASIDFSKAYDQFKNKLDETLEKDAYWDYESGEVNQDANIYIHVYAGYRMDPNGPVKFFDTVEDLMASDPEDGNAWYMLQMGVGSETYYEGGGGLPAAEAAFSTVPYFLGRDVKMTNPDIYGNQGALMASDNNGREKLSALSGQRFFRSTGEVVDNIYLMTPRTDFRRIAETYLQGNDATYREGRWLWGFVGDPYGFKLYNKEMGKVARLASHFEFKRRSYNRVTEEYTEWQTPAPENVVRLFDGYKRSSSTEEMLDYKDTWEMAAVDQGAENSFRLLLSGKGRYLSSIDNTTDVLNSAKVMVAHPWNWSDQKYKTVTVNVYRDRAEGTPVHSRTFLPQERAFMAGDVIDGTEGHFYLPHATDDNFVNDEQSDDHLIDVPFELKRRFCTYTVEGGQFTVQDTDDKQTMNLIYKVQEPDEDHLFIPRFISEDELASFRATGENDMFNGRPKADYYYFMDIGSELGLHAYIDNLDGENNRHPYKVANNRFSREDPSQLHWFFVGDPYGVRLFNVFQTIHQSDKEYNLARNYHPDNNAGVYGDVENEYNRVYMEEVRTHDPAADRTPHGRFYWEMVEPRHMMKGDKVTDTYYKETHKDVAYRYDRIKDQPFALRVTRNNLFDRPDASTVEETRLGRGTSYYLTSSNSRSGSRPFNFNTYSQSLYFYRDEVANQRGNQLEAATLVYPDLIHAANMNPETPNDGGSPSSMFTAVPVGRVYVTVYDHENIKTTVTDYELSDFYGITERFLGLPANLQRDFCTYTKICGNAEMTGESLADTDGYVEVTNGTAHLYAFYQETKYSPFCKMVDGTLRLTDAHGNADASSREQGVWQNMSVDGYWAFFNSNFRGFDYTTAAPNPSRIDFVHKDESVSADAATTADDWRFRKGLSWALIGDPYNFKLLNKRDITEGDISAGLPVDGEYLAYKTQPAYLSETDHAENTTELRINPQSEAIEWTLLRNPAKAIDDTKAVFFLSESSMRRTEVAGPVNAAMTTSIFTKYDKSRDVLMHNTDHGYIVEQGHNLYTNYHMGDIVSLVPSDQVDYGDGKLVGAGNEGFDAIVNVYNRLNELVATTGWTELSRKRSTWDLDNHLPYDVRRWSCDYQLWADATMTSTPFKSYRDVDSDGNYLIKDGGIVYVTYNYDEALFSTENEYRWVNPFFNWDDKKETWPLVNRDVYKYTAEIFGYIKSGAAGNQTIEYRLDNSNIRKQNVNLFLDQTKPTIPYMETREGWMESPKDNTKGLDPERAYAFSSHQYKPKSQYTKAEWDALSVEEQTKREAEDMKVQKWALIGDPYKFILYNYYRRSDAYNEDKNAYYLQYKDGKVINSELPDADRQVADGEAPEAGYSKDKLRGVYWTWKVDGTGYTYRKKDPEATGNEIETTTTDHSCEVTGECTVDLRPTFYETNAAGKSTGVLKAGYLAVCDIDASSQYDKSRLTGSILGYATFKSEERTRLELNGEEYTGDKEVKFTINGTEYTLNKGDKKAMMASAYTKGFNDKFKGYITPRAGDGVTAFDTTDGDGNDVYMRDYYNSADVEHYDNYEKWREAYATPVSYTFNGYRMKTGYTALDPITGAEYEPYSETRQYYTGQYEKLSLHLIEKDIEGAMDVTYKGIDRDGVKIDRATYKEEPEEDIITYKKVQATARVAEGEQFLTITGKPSTVENKLQLGDAYRFLVTTMPIHAASVTFHLDPEDHGQDNGGRTSKRNFKTDPIYDHVTEDYGIGNDLVLPWLMRRQYCDYKYYLVTADGVSPQQNETEKSAVSNWTIDDIKYGMGDNGFNVGRLEWGGKPERSANTAYKEFWNSYDPTPLKPTKSGQVEVPDEWEGKHVYIRVTYEPNPDRWESSDWTAKNPDKVHWYNLMTQKMEDMPQYLMQYTRTDKVRGKNSDQLGHTTNDYLWAVEGDPYGFLLHNRYSAHWHNGVSPDDGATWPEANERWDKAILTTDYVNSRERHNYAALDEHGVAIETAGSFTTTAIKDDEGKVTAQKAEYQADIHFANADANAYGRMLDDKARTDDGVKDATHTPDANKLYEAMTGNYRVAMMLHPVKASINTRDENGIKYYTSYLFNGVNWPVQLNYLQEWMAMRNVYCNWMLTLPSAAQLLPYWERAGYALTLRPDVAAAKHPVRLYASETAYTDGTLTTDDVDLYDALTCIRDGGTDTRFNADKKYGKINIDRLLSAARLVAHNPRNLVPMPPAGNYFRLMAYSSVTDYVSSLGADRYATAPLHQEEAAADGSMHFYETLDAGRTFDEMPTYAMRNYSSQNVRANRYTRDDLGLPSANNPAAQKATRGQMPVEAATADPAAVFHVKSSELLSPTHYFWTAQTQGAAPGEGVYLNNERSSLGVKTELDVQDIGVGAVQIQQRTVYEGKQPDQGDARKPEGSYDYLSCNPAWAMMAAKTGNELNKTSDGIYDTRWMLQPIGDEVPNVAGSTYQRPLNLRVYADRQTGSKLYYASLMLPYDVLLQDGAYAYVPELVKTVDYNGEEITYVRTKLINRKMPAARRGNQFVPAGTGVIVRVSEDDVHTGYTMHGDEYKYITMTLPTPTGPSTAIANEVKDAANGGTIAEGVYLEQVLDRSVAADATKGIGQAPASGKSVYVFGQYVTEDGEYSPVGFYRNMNHNWYDDPEFTTLEDEWYQRRDDTEWDSDNLYVRHNKVYILHDTSAPGPSRGLMDGPTMLPVHFDGDPEPGVQPVDDDGDGAWYTVGGVRLKQAPQRHGVYIKRGKRVIR